MSSQKFDQLQIVNNIKSYNSLPFLYRYEDEKWIDEFFATGNLKIGSFESYKAYEDNELGDKDEGKTISTFQGNNNKSFTTVGYSGHNEYCLSTSTILSEKLKKTFSRNSVFRINDPLMFMIEIAKKLPKSYAIRYGNCVYIDVYNVHLNIPLDDNALNFIKPDLKQIDAMPNGPNPYLKDHGLFIKKMKYQHQSEYRLLWSVDSIVKENIYIYCPEAAQYCQKIN